MAGIDYAQRAAAIVRDAGGYVVGRTRLQKIGFFLEAAGLGAGFPFRYKHYGPYSEQLADAAQYASALHLMFEREATAQWGGSYSTFTANLPADPMTPPSRERLAREMANADAVELELAATALYLWHEGYRVDPWSETARRKPEKADGERLQNARQLYQQLRLVPTPRPLPAI